MFISMPHSIEDPERWFPTIYRRCFELGLKMERDWLPVGPAAHYAMEWSLHRPRRTHYPSGASCLWGGRPAPASTAPIAPGKQLPVGGPRLRLAGGESRVNGTPLVKMPGPAVPSLPAVRGADALQRISWHWVGPNDRRQTLRRALLELENSDRECRGMDVEGLETANMALVISLVAKAALLREESRGAHYRGGDFPKADPSWRRHIILSSGAKTRALAAGG